MKKNLLTILLTVSCSCTTNITPQNVIERKIFVAMYVMLLDSAQVVQSAPGDSTLSPVAMRILKRHEATPEEFKATILFYNSDTRKWKEFYEEVVKTIDERMLKKANQ